MRKQLFKVVSGGQTGIDQLALRLAKRYGIPTGGYMPENYLTEQGPMPEIAQEYNLIALPQASWTRRTKANIDASDGTVIFGNLTGGTKATFSYGEKVGKHMLVMPDTATLIRFIRSNGIKVLNVAGNRMSLLTSAHYEFAHTVLDETFAALMNQAPQGFNINQ